VGFECGERKKGFFDFFRRDMGKKGSPLGFSLHNEGLMSKIRWNGRRNLGGSSK